MTNEHDSSRWQTPPEIFDPIMEEFDFDLDAAADHVTKRLNRYQGLAYDSLSSKPWQGTRIWLNPPYGKQLEPFIRRAHKEWAVQSFDPAFVLVALIPFRCRAAWWHDCVIGKAQQVRCVRKRIRFIRPDGTRGNFTGSCDSCVVVWRGGWHGITSMVSL